MTIPPRKFKDLDCQIKGVSEPIIDEYFIQLNNANFPETAGLFTEQGILQPPFGKILQGRPAIAQYLQKEAVGMKFCPNWEEISFNEADNSHRQVQIQGKVITHQFTVNVNWVFQLTPTPEISLLEIKLLASLNELAQLNRH
ncbi:MAG: nuclear transport factor 2 family protein [Snowella sp.]|nr:nuclear transport factor 2 family protein [Snowella sp.]